ncbi:signal recognition particle, SRP14 subunit [Aspergillus ambiguus]|uniref:signal recognition particle 14 kDa protein n=1 Tax=Aspergillus ambiguus TaxID=176160 RepID=UPI003CCCC191
MPPHLSHEEFFTSLADLLSKTSQKARGSVYLTQKPMLHGTDSGSTSQPAILIRASDGNTNAPNPKKDKVQKKSSPSTKVKLSTLVAPEELETFYARYAEVCKGGMTGLKKRDRKQKKAKKGAAGKAAKA